MTIMIKGKRRIKLKEEKYMKKRIVLGISISIILTLLVACSQDVGEITLESIKKTLTNAGYTIDENYVELYGFQENEINSIGGFSFVFSGAHGNVLTPVLEFRDNASAEFYAEYVNSSGHFLAITNDTFLTVVEAHHGVAHANEQAFFENLINGRSIK